MKTPRKWWCHWCGTGVHCVRYRKFQNVPIIQPKKQPIISLVRIWISWILQTLSVVSDHSGNTNHFYNFI